MTDEQADRRPGIERHIQTIVTSITLALLMWTGMTLVDLRDRLARMEEKMISQAAEVQAAKAEKFTHNDWKREKEILAEQFKRLERDHELSCDEFIRSRRGK
jgi:hypothetical protein